MPQEPACLTPSPAAVVALDSASDQLRHVGRRLIELGTAARHAAAATDWQTPAARAFHAHAERLAEDVFALRHLLEPILSEVAHARARASIENPWDCR